MNEDEATELARNFLSKQIEINIDVKKRMYRCDPKDYFRFSFNLSGLRGYGGSEYVSVCKTTGEVRKIGFHGE